MMEDEDNVGYDTEERTTKMEQKNTRRASQGTSPGRSCDLLPAENGREVDHNFHGSSCETAGWFSPNGFGTERGGMSFLRNIHPSDALSRRCAAFVPTVTRYTWLCMYVCMCTRAYVCNTRLVPRRCNFS